MAQYENGCLLFSHRATVSSELNSPRSFSQPKRSSALLGTSPTRERNQLNFLLGGSTPCSLETTDIRASAKSGDVDLQFISSNPRHIGDNTEGTENHKGQASSNTACHPQPLVETNERFSRESESANQKRKSCQSSNDEHPGRTLCEEWLECKRMCKPSNGASQLPLTQSMDLKGLAHVAVQPISDSFPSTTSPNASKPLTIVDLDIELMGDDSDLNIRQKCGSSPVELVPRAVDQFQPFYQSASLQCYPQAFETNQLCGTWRHDSYQNAFGYAEPYDREHRDVSANNRNTLLPSIENSIGGQSQSLFTGNSTPFCGSTPTSSQIYNGCTPLSTHADSFRDFPLTSATQFHDHRAPQHALRLSEAGRQRKSSKISLPENPNKANLALVDVQRRPSLYGVPLWTPEALPHKASSRSDFVNHLNVNGINASTEDNRLTYDNRFRSSACAYPSRCSEISLSRGTCSTDGRKGSAHIMINPPMARKIIEQTDHTGHSPNLIIDIAQTCQANFPFAVVAERHQIPVQKVFDTFSAIIQLPLLRSAHDKRRHGSLGKRRIKEYRDARRAMKRAQETGKEAQIP